MAKKESQADRLLQLLSDGEEHSTDEIMRRVYGAGHLGTARIASRINDLRNRGYEIPEARRDAENKTLFWYRLGNPPKPKPRIEYRPVEVNGVMMMRAVEV